MKIYDTEAGRVTVNIVEGRVADIKGPPAAILGLNNYAFVLEPASRTTLCQHVVDDVNSPSSGPWRGYVDPGHVSFDIDKDGGFSVG